MTHGTRRSEPQASLKRRVQILKGRVVCFEPLGTAQGLALDKIAIYLKLQRHTNENDESLRTRCRHALETAVGLYPGAFTDP